MRLVTLSALTSAEPKRLVHAGGVVRALPCRTGEESLALPVAELERLGLSTGDRVHIDTPDDKHVHLGPYVGVLLGKDGMAKLRGEWAGHYRRVLRLGREAGAVPYFFRWTDVDVKAGTVRGWTHRDGRWAQWTLPMPDIIYNRATHPDPAERAAVRTLLVKLQALYGVHFINRSNSFSKMAVSEALRFFAPFAPLAPETELFMDADSLASMLKRHPQVFLKANYGTHGSDVLRVRPHKQSWQVSGRCGGRAVEELFTELKQVQEFMRLLRGDDEWVMQQGIALPRIEDRVYDLRVVVQKNRAGEWAVPLILIRWAQPGKVAANMSQGAEPFLPRAFRARFGDAIPADLEETAAAAALKVAQALEARCGLLGEIGVDLGLDRDGHPWVFEANAKPVHPQVDGMEQPLYAFPFRYACHLAGLAWAGRHSGIAVCH